MDYKNNTIVAIDPGKSGGIATFGNKKIHTAKMPNDVRDIKLYLEYTLQTYPNVIVFIEKVQAYISDDEAGGKKFGINKMLANYTELLTVIKLLNIPFVEVYPISWQTTLKLRIPKEKITKVERKNRYRKHAERCFPELGLLNLSVSDAVCLVHFALIKLKDDVIWVDNHVQNKPKENLF